MLSFTNTRLSFYLSFLLCIACLVASAPVTTTPYHHRQIDLPFPYGKLAEKMLHVNDISYMIDDREEDRFPAYPIDDSTAFFDDLPDIPPTSPETLELPVLPTIIPYFETRSLSSFVHRIPHFINQVVAREWNTALVLLRRLRKSQNLLEE